MEEALAFNPNDVQAMFNLSGAHALNGDLQTAFEIAQQVESIQPNFPGLQEWI